MTTIDFWGELDGDVLRCLSEAREGLSPAEIGSRIGISEDAAQSIVMMLAHEGKVRICSVAYGQPSVL
jgi:DNA-binding CsgD family transcriptional regulator